MPRETIRNLALDVERVLVAGAHLAAADTGLARDKGKLDALVAQLGAKAPPVLGRLSELTATVMSAPPKEQAEALVSLAMSVAQVRAAQAQLALVAEDEPLAPAEAVGTPCNAKDLYALHDALVHTGPGRLEKIREALERDDIADLRLVHAAIQAMGDGYGEIADTVSAKVVPRFGRAIVGPVRSRLRFPGKVLDGRRLRALVAVEKGAARALLEQALKEGSADMREAALDAIATELPGIPEFEPLVLGILSKERAGGVRRAAVRALKGYASDASLDALFAATEDTHLFRAASEALGGSKHPDIVPRLLLALSRAVALSATKDKKATGAADAKDHKEAQTRQRLLAVALLGALARIEDPRIVPVARELIPSLGKDAALAVLKSGGESELRALADLLQGDEEELYGVAVRAAIRLSDETFDRLMAPLRAKDRESKHAGARIDAVVDSGFAPSGDAWVNALIEALAQKPRPLRVATLLGRTKDRRATKPLLDLITALNKDSRTLPTIVGALGELGDPSAFDPLLQVFVAKSGTMGWWGIAYPLAQLGDRTCVEKVRALVANDKTDTYQTRHLLRRLEQRFPGA